MAKLALLIWVVLGVVLAGIGVTAILAMPDMAGRELRLIPWAAIAGYVAALPLSFLIAKMITGRAVPRG